MRDSVLHSRRCPKASDEKRVAATVRENAGGASLKPACVHMLT